ncbi:hypothetical protein MCAP1_002520 [Malassezia caprae]|uniref:Uncharacterized protein n=1 Tax=Malassezia caprae TaxID=1381934 RepID=A0AAF0E8J0_9BASI|nr:hypothetical protein MCAP1_002520 [Malassezia caprae]
MHPRRPAPPAPGQGPPPLSPFETWIAFPMLFAACVYNTLQLVPVALLPPTLARVLGYPSDLFRLARLATTTPTRELREALAPAGWMAGTAIVRLWREKHGAQAMENLLWRLSSKLYLVLGAEPLMACAFCSSDTEYKAYAIYQVLTVYLAHAWVLALLTMPAFGTLPAFMDYVLQRGRVAPPDELRPVRTRAHMRIVALSALAVLSALDVVRILWATDVPVQGSWQHWHANAHLARHMLLSLLLTLVWICTRVQLPAIKVIHALQAMSAVAGAVEARSAAARGSPDRGTTHADPDASVAVPRATS